MPIKIATFNCENLFSRSKVVNREDRKDGDDIMTNIDLLREELEKDAYNSARIISLYKEVHDYIDIVEVREKLFKGTINNLAVKAKGKKNWDGFIQYKRTTFSDAAKLNTAKVINSIDADIISLIEVEDKVTLDSFNSRLITKPYPFTMLIDAFDPRGIDVALLSRFPLENIRTHMFDKTGKLRIFSRDCLEVDIKPDSGDIIHFFVNHFKSQGYGTQAGNDAKRLSQTQRVAKILDERLLNLDNDKVVILGDFNAPPNSASLTPLLNVQGLEDVLKMKIPAEEDRWTYYYSTRQQIDYMLVSKPLQSACNAAGIERRGIYNLQKISKGKEQAWQEIQDSGAIAAASDHGAVWAEFAD
jgi:endonuclease/exonuclease/phosphatase family metal-dependent hydrolase